MQADNLSSSLLGMIEPTVDANDEFVVRDEERVTRKGEDGPFRITDDGCDEKGAKEEGNREKAGTAAIQIQDDSDGGSYGDSCDSNAAVDGCCDNTAGIESSVVEAGAVPDAIRASARPLHECDRQCQELPKPQSRPAEHQEDTQPNCAGDACVSSTGNLPQESTPLAAPPRNTISQDQSTEDGKTSPHGVEDEVDEQKEEIAEETPVESAQTDEIIPTTSEHHDGSNLPNNVEKTQQPFDVFFLRSAKSYEISIRFSGGMTFAQCDEYQRETDVQFSNSKNEVDALQIENKKSALAVLRRLRNKTSKAKNLFRSIVRKNSAPGSIKGNSQNARALRSRSLSMDDITVSSNNSREKKPRRRNSGSTLVTMESDGSGGSMRALEICCTKSIGPGNSTNLLNNTPAFLRTVVFDPVVTVHPVPKASYYPRHLREALWMSRREASDSKRRNEFEYAYDSNDWTMATEECDMCEDPFTGSLVHPAHVTIMSPKKRECKKSWPLW